MKEEIHISLDELPIEWRSLIKIWFWTSLITGLVANAVFFLLQSDPAYLGASITSPTEGLQRIVLGFWSAVVYTTVFLTSCLTSVYTGCRIRPRFDKKHLAIQITLLIPIFAASFILATWICQITGVNTGFDNRTKLLVIALITLSATITITLIIYMITLIRQANSLKAAVAEANLSVLQAQVNPHFLFNTLNSIAALIRFKPKKAEMVTQNLSDLFRDALNMSKEGLVSLERELETAERYISIEQARFGDKLKFTTDVEADSQNHIPSFSIQPLLENAVKYGMERVDSELEITLIIRKGDDRLHIRVVDSGKGLLGQGLQTLMEQGSGLRNLKNRLKYYFGDDAGLQIKGHGIEFHHPLK